MIVLARQLSFAAVARLETDNCDERTHFLRRVCFVWKRDFHSDQELEDSSKRFPPKSSYFNNMGIVDSISDSVFEPGASAGLMNSLNLIFAALFLSLLFLAATAGFSWHIVFLGILAIGLLASINW